MKLRKKKTFDYTYLASAFNVGTNVTLSAAASFTLALHGATFLLNCPSSISFLDVVLNLALGFVGTVSFGDLCALDVFGLKL